MEADIVLKEDEIEKSFEAASSDFLSYLDKSIERLEDEQELTGQYKEDMIRKRGHGHPVTDIPRYVPGSTA